MTAADPPRRPPPGFRDLLERQDYTEEGVRRALGPAPGLGLLLDREVYRRRLAAKGPPAATFAALFHAGLTVEREEAVQALSPLRLDDLIDARLLAETDDRVRPLVGIGRLEGMWFASDVPSPGADGVDHVTGVSVAARMLAFLTVRRRVGSALDIGTGCGVQALLAARHCERVTGVDVNPRALAFAAFNAELNAVTNVELVEGSWFEPVEGGRFDLVVANPPYVVSPDTAFTYRDSDLPGDSVSRLVISGAADHLAESGFACVECSWIHAPDGDWREPLEAWIEGRGCDAVLLRYFSDDGLTYAADWNKPLNLVDPDRYVADVDRWVEHYTRAGIEAIGLGFVALRRRSGGRNFVRAVEPKSFPSKPAGAHLERLFAARDLLRSLPDDRALLDLRLTLVQGARVDRRFEAVEGGVRELEARVELSTGVGFAVRVPVEAAPALVACDGTRPIGEAIAKAQAREDVALASVRRLARLGLLAASEAEDSGTESRQVVDNSS